MIRFISYFIGAIFLVASLVGVANAQSYQAPSLRNIKTLHVVVEDIQSNACG